ncbi:MAG: translesion error-prone DNA polymerase V autoproteolytic subunit [Planctomycetia bacterium]|nr:translesion error-prone DNA polymerase V autoproteolytic subunit [Planctomycetia bacterium]
MARGGKRKGAGRPKGTGKFGEPTKAIRLPISMIDRIMTFIEQKGLCFPMYSDQVQAGFPSPADDTPAEKLDLGSYLVQNPASTFFVKVTGESMIGAGIFPDDLLIVDRSITASNGDVVVAAVDGEFTVKRLFISQRKIELRPENKKFNPLTFKDESELNIWGVVKNVIHRV